MGCGSIQRERGCSGQLSHPTQAARTGPICFDAAFLNLPYVQVQTDEIGTVSGVHSALCAALEMGSFSAGLLLNRPEQFGLLLAMSLCSVRSAQRLPGLEIS